MVTTHLERGLNLGMDPMCDDIVAVGDTRVCKEYPIEIGISKVIKVIDGERMVFCQVLGWAIIF